LRATSSFGQVILNAYIEDDLTVKCSADVIISQYFLSACDSGILQKHNAKRRNTNAPTGKEKAVIS